MKNPMKNSVVLLLIAGLFACNKPNNVAVSPDITIGEMELLTSSSLRVQVNVDYSNGINPSNWGVCFGLSANPVIEDNVAVPGSGYYSYSNFTVEIEELLPGTQYFGRGFLTQGSTTDYSLNFSFTTPDAGVGEFKEGGVVFWVDPTDPSHGLICSVEQINAKWGSQGVGIDGTNTDLGSGEQNTSIITDLDPYYGAAAFCNDLSSEGYDDWFLPSIDELEVIYAYRNIITQSMLQNVGSYQSSNYYWSSSQVDHTNAWYYNFGNQSEVLTGSKDNSYGVKPIRAY